MKDLLQYFLDGLSIGSIYALVALGIVVVYRGTGHVNFAQGEMALFSTLVTWWLHDKGLPLLAAIAISAALAFGGGALIEIGLMRPATKRSAFAPVVIAIGLFQGLNSLSSLLFPKAGQGLPFPSLFPNEPGDFVSIFGASWRIERIGVLAVVLVITVLLFALFQKTKVGLAMRAVANNPDSAKLAGVPTGRILMFSWALAAVIGAVGGALKAGIDTNVSIGSMFSVFLLSAAAATLGGLDSPGGAVIGGLALGVMESLVGNYPDDWPGSDWIGIETKTAVAFLIILVVLLVRPAGLFGSVKVERV
ncbi:MAG: branched-chain amino acid ABC transporter permease [Ilumatobacteraceae bacterium]